jgi:hypothetical protein
MMLGYFTEANNIFVMKRKPTFKLIKSDFFLKIDHAARAEHV